MIGWGTDLCRTYCNGTRSVAVRYYALGGELLWPCANMLASFIPPGQVVLELPVPWWTRREDVAVEVGEQRLAVAVRGTALELERDCGWWCRCALKDPVCRRSNRRYPVSLACLSLCLLYL